ncbi:MAG: peptide deformylase [Gemmatimonadota bacterium]
MSALKIELLGSSFLREKAAEVTEIDDDLRKLIGEMYEAMYEAEGIGLAGPQVGVSKRVLVVDLKSEDHPRLALINPTVLDRSKDQEKEEEGCLSIPGVSALVERPTEVVVEATDAEGQPIRIEAEGLLARCLQHEIDHLDGVLFIDHLSALKRSMLVKKYKQLRAEEEGKSRERTPARSSG